MAQQLGADPDQLRALARQFEQEATAVENARSDTASRLSSSFWEGKDADRFTNAWYGTHSKRLGVIAQTLRSAAGTLRDQAQRQENISRA